MSNAQTAGVLMIQTFGMAEKSIRARDVNNPGAIFNIKIDEATGCPVQKLDGSKTFGLDDTGLYQIRGYVDTVPSKDGTGVIHMLTPLAAKELDPFPADWDALPAVSVEANQRTRAMGERAAADNAPAAQTQTAEDTEAAPI